jgi:hypothetical protein
MRLRRAIVRHVLAVCIGALFPGAGFSNADMSKTKPSGAAAKTAGITRKMVEERYARAQDLAGKGSHEEALAEFLWCFDEGMVAVSSYTGVRVSFLLGEITRLGRDYPPAIEALRRRRDALEEAIAAAPGAGAGLADYASLNHYLKEDGRNLALFERLPAGDKRRGMLGLSVYEELGRAGRYAEALEAHPYDRMVSLFEAIAVRRKQPGFSKAEQERLDERQLAHTVRLATGNIEVLVGAGKVEEAEAYAKKLLAYDGSAATREKLHAAAVRAGRADLFAP